MHFVLLDDAWAIFAEFLRQAVLPYPWMLDKVIVDGDDLVFIAKRHLAPF
ncbi:hypothetical protein MUNTM_35110 [Mycobacterium sp. MUNTM1]